MKIFRKLNFQLFFAATCTILVLLFTFGFILPYNIRNYFDDQTFEQLLMEQRSFLKNPENNLHHHEDIIHLVFNKDNSLYVGSDYVAKPLFEDINANLYNQNSKVDRYVYHHQNNHIYYVINKSNPDYDIVTVKLDTVNSNITNTVFSEIVNGLSVILSLLLIGILYWSFRLINNLKEIKRVVKRIGEGNLDFEIKSNAYTYEVNDLMHEINEMRKSLKQNEQLKNEMVHNMSHDLKTPISIIKMCSESIVDEVYPYGTPEATAKVIHEQAERLEIKVKKLLYLNHLTHLIDQKITDVEVIQLKPLIESVAKYMQDQHPHIEIELKLDESTVLGDEEKWRVIFENMIDNSQRFANKKIVIKVHKGTIKIFNDGPAINEREMGSIFKPFEVGVGGVTGLGLSIVFKTLTLYHYSITYKNLDNGVSFIIKPMKY